jgi:prephenate dehydratase
MSAGERARVGYLGPAGTFTEEALLASASSDAVEPVPLASIFETVDAVSNGSLRWSIVPIENSLDGSVSVTLDLLAEQDRAVEIVGEAQLRVRHSLIAAEPVELDRIETVLTHPQVPGQCARFLRSELPQARVLPANSTADAVRLVATGRQPGSAAIGTALAARIYEASVLREGIEDRADNETRFVGWASEGGRTPPPLAAATGASQASGGDDRGPQAEWKTSLVFWGRGAERPGWLVRCLGEFASREINLTKIESRPRRERLGRYMFFADLSARADDESAAAAIEGLREVCEHVRVLGSYPAAQPALDAAERRA